MFLMNYIWIIKILKGDEAFSTLAMGVLYLARAHKSNALEMTVCVPAENIKKSYVKAINNMGLGINE